MVDLPRLGGEGEDRIRLEQLLDGASTSGFLLRSSSTLLAADTAAKDSSTLSVLSPEMRVVYNSSIPYSLNEGALWAGRGRNIELSAGVVARSGPFTLILLPHVLLQQNQDFQTLPYPSYLVPARSAYASPWYPAGESIDRPSRFGDDPIYGFSLGQSSLTADIGPAAVGVTTENLWWGPGIRNALVMSNNAPGFPQIFVRTARPLQTVLGAVEGRWLVGGLSDSGYFDDDPIGDKRSLSALALTLRPAFDPNLTVGFTRSVYAPIRRSIDWTDSWLDVFRNVGRPAASAAALAALQDGSADEDEAPYPVLGPDQIFSFFGRWVFPEAGFEAYGEWGRTERPSGVRDFLVSPHHTQGYTVGLQWATRLRSGSAFRLQTEVTNLELSSTYRHRPTLSWYTSASVPHGYTNRGRVLGAAIGPGASSQWLAADYLDRAWQIGVFAGRVRWDNGAFYRQTYSSPTYLGHDVSVLGGIRGAFNVGPVGVMAEIQTATRLNYLFQHIPYSQADILSTDIRNHTLRLTLGRARDLR